MTFDETVVLHRVNRRFLANYRRPPNLLQKRRSLQELHTDTERHCCLGEGSVELALPPRTFAAEKNLLPPRQPHKTH